LSPFPAAGRRDVLALLFVLSFLSYLLRMNISVAQQYMLPELGLTDIQIGQVFTAFMVGYTLFQVPAGRWGDRHGARIVLTVAAVIWGVTTLLTGTVPGVLTHTASDAFVSLLALRFVLGVGEAAMFPVAGRVVADWVPAPGRAFSNAIVILGATAGSAFTPPLVANAMERFGWRATFTWTAPLPIVVAGLWWWLFRDHPAAPAPLGSDLDFRNGTILAPKRKSRSDPKPAWRGLVTNRNVAWLCLSYFLDSYVLFIFVFWLFKYLVDVRKFTIASGGWAASVPFIVAAVALPSAGYLSDRLGRRLGLLGGRRTVAMTCLVLSGSMLFVGASAADARVALAAIALSVGALFSTEGPYWSTVIALAGPHAGAAGGIMNMAGNLGGVVSTSAVPILVHYLGWYGALASGSACAVVSAVCWLMVREGETSRE
jgi:MFS transporter, ACS family, glucarate transporter